MTDFTKELAEGFRKTQMKVGNVTESQGPETDGTYTAAPKRGGGSYRARGRGNYEGGDYGSLKKPRGNGEYRGRGGYRNQTEGEDGGEEVKHEIRTRSERGTNRGRGRGGEFRGRGANTRGGDRPRGGRIYDMSQKHQENDSDSEPGFEQHEIDFMDRMVKDHRAQLKGLVNDIQIKNKCIQLDFDENKIIDWVRELTHTEKKFEGLKDFQWNETVTPETKKNQRAQMLADQERKKKEWIQKKIEQKERERRKIEWEERKKIRDEQAEQRRIQKEARIAEREAKKAEYLANKAKEAEEAGDESAEKEASPTSKGKARQYKAKDPVPANEAGETVVVKSGSKALVYKRKEATAQPAVEVVTPTPAPVKDEAIVDDAENDYDEDYDDEYDSQEIADRKKSDDENSELLRQAAEQNQRDQEQRLKAQKEQEEKEKKAKAAAEAAAKLEEAARIKREAEEKAAAEKKAHEEKLKKAAEEAQKKQQPAAQKMVPPQMFGAQGAPNPFMMQPPMMNPMMMAPAGEKGEWTPQQMQQMMEQQQLMYQQMAMQQQMFQAWMAQQFAMQQQMSGVNAGEGVNPMQMMGGFPMMPNIASANMAMPGMPTVDGAGQMHMPMMPMMPMGMQYPYPQNPQQFQSQNKDKK